MTDATPRMNVIRENAFSKCDSPRSDIRTWCAVEIHNPEDNPRKVQAVMRMAW